MKKKSKPSLENCRKADDYRTEISSFIGQNGVISGEYCEYNAVFKFGFRYNYEMILLKDVTATCNGEQKYVQHLWIKLPFGYCVRNKIRKGDICTFAGSFSEYIKLAKQGYRKNIGFRRSATKKESDLIEYNFCMAVI